MATTLLEQVLQSRLAMYLRAVDSQFGFKQANWTDMAIFSLKQTADFYRNQGTSVYKGFIDVKKVFYRVYHWILVNKLLDKDA